MTLNRIERTIETGLENLTDQIRDGLRHGKFTWDELQSAVSDKSHRAVKYTDKYVHQNPWKMIGIAALIGGCIGLLMHRR